MLLDVGVFVDRLLGLVELALMAGVMLGLLLLGGERDFAKLRLPVICMAVIIVAVAGMMTFLLSQRLASGGTGIAISPVRAIWATPFSTPAW